MQYIPSGVMYLLAAGAILVTLVAVIILGVTIIKGGRIKYKDVEIEGDDDAKEEQK